MPSLIELFEERAKGCIELADRLEDPNARKLLLETATDWMRGAAALRRAAAKRSPPPNADDDGVRSLSAPPTAPAATRKAVGGSGGEGGGPWINLSRWLAKIMVPPHNWEHA